MNVEDTIRTALVDGARELDPPGRGPSAASTRARQLRRRRRAVPAALTATVVGATAIAVWAQPDQDDPGVVADQAATPATELDLEWHEAGAATVVNNNAVFIASDGVYYALATAPGTKWEDYPDSNIPQTVYRSDDGVTWTAGATQQDAWISDLDERGGVLYAIGTAPGAADDAVATKVGVSSDGGSAWNNITLPTTAAPPDANVDISLSGVTPRIAVFGDTLVASVTTQYYTDFASVLTPEERDAGYYVEMRQGSLDVVLAGDCDRIAVPPDGTPIECERNGEDRVARSIPWSDVGLSGPGDLQVQELFVSTDGATWERVADAPMTGYAHYDITGTPNGLFASAATWNEDGTTSAQLFRSLDGKAWEPVSSGLGAVTSVGVMGSRLVAVDAGEATTVATSDDGGTSWATTDLGGQFELEPYGYGTFAAGPLGAALVAYPKSKAPDPVLLTTADGTSWNATPLAEITGKTGQYPAWVTVDADHITIVTGLGGDVSKTARTYVGTPKA